METDGTYEPSDTRGAGVPRPATPPEAPVPPPVHPPVPSVPPAPSAALPVPPVPSAAPPVPSVPPKPVGAPGASGGPVSRVAAWLDAPRPEAGVGIWRYRHEEVAEPPERLAPVTVAGMLIPVAIGLVLWSAWLSNLFPYKTELLWLLTPDGWFWPATTSPVDWHGTAARMIYDGLFFAALVSAIGFLGSWRTIVRHYFGRFRPATRAAAAGAAAFGALVLVWPEAFGLDWDPLPVVGPVLALLALLTGGFEVFASPFAVYTLYTLITLLVLWPFARLGDWPGLLRARRARKTPAVPSTPTGPVVPPSQWPALRAAGEQRAADVLAAEVAEGRMNDVDCARVNRAWRDSERDQVRRAALVGKLLRDGAAAGAHPSGERDLPGRAAPHDLLLGQVRVGRYADGERTPHPYRRAGLALDPGLLGTSLLAVGPSGSGKTRALVAPVVESLTLQALAGATSVVAVAGAGAPLGPDTAYDVVIRLGDPASAHDLDLYAGATDPDEAAAFLAEGLVGDMPGVETRRAATVLAQLVGPYRAAYGRFPTVPVLRELLEARPETLRTLHDLLPEDGAPTMRRELDSRIRQVGTATDLGPVLADRLAALDRPAFAEFFGTDGGTDKGDTRPFSLRAVAQHPVRVRICLPDDGAHEEAARLLNRLLLAQFQTVVRDRSPRGHFACLVLDDAAGALTPGTVRGLQRLRPQNAGAVLALRTLAEVPAELHGPLLAGVGCRMALAGIPNWDGRAFAEAWGTERVETTEVAHHTVFADQPMTRALHALRKLMTGKAVTTEAVTVREVERERWSASELAHEVPPGHAVLSLTHVRGEHTPPLLVDLRS
ncbi:ATP/GTP-binding protein [Streptomyces sp. SKN60]|uniref:ATP/GTP-binding protein n=1 Tax=Streptomyces sp. SKN60 TaxID=2855506 RepID=UPI0022453B6B|nr:ATP/GTP-binding protein [Streptomyces sp. SKN60]MCX2181541.1 ATP/GTP-binding protein [Streptomyces sp. SKN60]